jgi:hypothetical protein
MLPCVKRSWQHNYPLQLMLRGSAWAADTRQQLAASWFEGDMQKVPQEVQDLEILQEAQSVLLL